MSWASARVLTCMAFAKGYLCRLTRGHAGSHIATDRRTGKTIQWTGDAPKPRPHVPL